MNLLNRMLDGLYPRFCVGCGVAVGDGDMHVCWDCFASFEIVASPFCSCCGDPADGYVDHDYICSWCNRAGPAFDLARSAGRYRGALRRIMHAFKYECALHAVHDLARMLTAAVRAHYADVVFDGVTSVPLHPSRERLRNYNQAALLARGLGRELRLDVFPRLIVRTRDTPTQTDLTARERKQNVRGAFAARLPQWIDGRTLLLVDDVMTTGATTNECARVLKDAGAAGVYVVTVARG